MSAHPCPDGAVVAGGDDGPSRGVEERHGPDGPDVALEAALARVGGLDPPEADRAVGRAGGDAAAAEPRERRHPVGVAWGRVWGEGEGEGQGAQWAERVEREGGEQGGKGAGKKGGKRGAPSRMASQLSSFSTGTGEGDVGPPRFGGLPAEAGGFCGVAGDGWCAGPAGVAAAAAGVPLLAPCAGAGAGAGLSCGTPSCCRATRRRLASLAISLVIWLGWGRGELLSPWLFAQRRARGSGRGGRRSAGAEGLRRPADAPASWRRTCAPRAASGPADASPGSPPGVCVSGAFLARLLAPEHAERSWPAVHGQRLQVGASLRLWRGVQGKRRRPLTPSFTNSLGLSAYTRSFSPACGSELRI